MLKQKKKFKNIW